MAAITCDFKQAENKVPNGFVYLPIAYPDALAAAFSRVMSSFFFHSKKAIAMMVCGDLRAKTLMDI